MGGHLVMSLLNGRSKGWLVLVAFLAWMVVSGLKHFLRFKNTKMRGGCPDRNHAAPSDPVAFDQVDCSVAKSFARERRPKCGGMFPCEFNEQVEFFGAKEPP